MRFVENADVVSSIMRALHEGVLRWTVPGGVLADCNEAAAHILGETREQLVGRTLDFPWRLTREDGSQVPPNERGAVMAVRTGQSQPTAVYRTQRPDGTWAWVRSTSVVLRGASQVPYAAITTFIDITELRRSQEEVKQIANRLADAIAGANVGSWELDVEANLATRNARWAEILGHTPSEIEPTLDALVDRIHPDDRERCEKAMEEGFSRGGPYVFDCRVRHKDGHWHWVQIRGKVVDRRADGRAHRVAGVLVDIDARMRMEGVLRTTLAENERLVRTLQAALESVRTLEGLLPICMYCKDIRDDGGAWSTIEAYVSTRSQVAFSHGICPSCYTREYGEQP